MAKNRHYYLEIILFGIIGVFIFLFFINNYSSAEGGSTPIISSIHFGSVKWGASYDGEHIALSAGNTIPIYISGLITDADGCEDINDVSANSLGVSFYRNGIYCPPSGGQANGRNCYLKFGEANDCEIIDCAGAGDNDAQFSCVFDNFAHYADSGLWKAQIIITDDEANTATSTTSSGEPTVDILTSINLPDPSIAFGSVGTGEQSANIPFIIENYGNDNDLDIKPTATSPAMVCSTGDVDVEEIKFSTVSSSWSSKTAMPDDTTFDLNLQKGSDSLPASQATLYWQATISTNTLGACSGTMNIVAL